MKIEEVISLVMTELNRAEEAHPDWPQDAVRAAAVVAELCGVLLMLRHGNYTTFVGSKHNFLYSHNFLSKFFKPVRQIFIFGPILRDDCCWRNKFI